MAALFLNCQSNGADPTEDTDKKNGKLSKDIKQRKYRVAVKVTLSRTVVKKKYLKGENFVEASYSGSTICDTHDLLQKRGCYTQFLIMFSFKSDLCPFFNRLQ